jgi:hypothetical protein
MKAILLLYSVTGDTVNAGHERVTNTLQRNCNVILIIL